MTSIDLAIILSICCLYLSLILTQISISRSFDNQLSLLLFDIIKSELDTLLRVPTHTGRSSLYTTNDIY